MKALERLENILSEYGLSEDDINYLLAQFLEEEAQLWISEELAGHFARNWF